jgi:hypothetical protein
VLRVALWPVPTTTLLEAVGPPRLEPVASLPKTPQSPLVELLRLRQVLPEIPSVVRVSSTQLLSTSCQSRLLRLQWISRLSPHLVCLLQYDHRAHTCLVLIPWGLQASTSSPQPSRAHSTTDPTRMSAGRDQTVTPGGAGAEALIDPPSAPVAKSGSRTQSAELKPQADSSKSSDKPQTRGRKGTIVTTGKMNKAGKTSHITPSKPGMFELSCSCSITSTECPYIV